MAFEFDCYCQNTHWELSELGRVRYDQAISLIKKFSEFEVVRESVGETAPPCRPLIGFKDASDNFLEFAANPDGTFAVRLEYKAPMKLVWFEFVRWKSAEAFIEDLSHGTQIANAFFRQDYEEASFLMSNQQ